MIGQARCPWREKPGRLLDRRDPFFKKNLQRLVEGRSTTPTSRPCNSFNGIGALNSLIGEN